AGGGEPAVGAERALAELGGGIVDDRLLFEGGAIEGPDAAGTHEEDGRAVGGNQRRKRMDRRAVGQLADRAFGVESFEELGLASAVGGEDDRLSVGRKGAV